MAKEYIEREAVKEKIERLRDKCGNNEMAFALNWAVSRTGKIPAADVVPVRHGRWIDTGDFISCSECNATRMKEFLCDYGVARRLDVRTNYCPNCGADMREES